MGTATFIEAPEARKVTYTPPAHAIAEPWISAANETSSALLKRLEFEQFLVGLSARFINICPDQAEAEIEDGLRKLVEFLGVDRASFGHLCPDNGFEMLASYAAPGADSFPLGPPPAGLAWYVNQIKRGRTVCYSEGDDLGPDAAEAVAMARTMGIRFHLGVPILVGGAPQFWQGIAAINKDRTFSDALVDRLHLVGEIFANALARRDADISVRRIQAELSHVTRVSSVGQLAASIAHELNQPLCAMVNNAQAAIRLLAMARPDLAEARRALADIVSDGNRTGEIVARSHGMLKRRQFELKPIQMNDLISDVASLVHSDAMIRRVGLHLQLADGLPLFSGDRVQLQQVLLNLIMNAMDATAEIEAGPREIIVTTLATAKHIQIVVRDTGKGLSIEVARRLFEPFFTTKQHGLGMGLTISQEIIKSHGGLLRAEPNVPRGTCLICELPRQNSPPSIS